MGKSVLRRIRLSLKNKPIFSLRRELCIKYIISYTAFFPTKVETSPLQIVLSFPELFVSK